MRVVVGTASCNKFFLETQQLFYSLHGNLPPGTTVVLLDNGLKERQLKLLKERFGFVKIITFTKQLSAWERSSYIFKIDVLQFVREHLDCDIYMWMDAKNVLKDNLETITKLLQKQPVWGTAPFSQAEHLWTDKRTLDALDISEEDRSTNQIQASGYMIDFTQEKGRNFAEQLINYSLVKDIITPEGSKKGAEPPTHRQDQSVLSALMKKNGFKIQLEEGTTWVKNHCTLHN